MDFNLKFDAQPKEKPFKFDEEDSFCCILNNVIVHPSIEEEWRNLSAEEQEEILYGDRLTWTIDDLD